MAGDGDSQSAIPAWGSPWHVIWATQTESDPRLELRIPVGPVTAVAFGELRQRPWVAVGLQERGAHRLCAGDPQSGPLRELPCDDPVRSLAFAMAPGDPLLVSGHRQGRLRFWAIEDGSLRLHLQRIVETGGHDVEEMFASQSLLVTRDAGCRVQCFSLPSGQPVQVPGTGEACALDVRGHMALMGGNHGLSLWDLANDRLAHLPLPAGFLRVRGVALSTVDGRDCAIVMDEAHLIAALDISAGALISSPIKAHVGQQRENVMDVASKRSPHPRLAAVNGTLAVPTRWLVHLWHLGTSRQETAPLASPAKSAVVQAVRWQDRDLLLTASDYDGVVALWDIGKPVQRPAGHEQTIRRVALAGPPADNVVASSDDGGTILARSPADEVVVSVDDGGTIVARFATDGHLVAQPLATEVVGTLALAAWRDPHGNLFAAQGAGSRHVGDPKLRRWNLTAGRPADPPVDAHLSRVNGVYHVPLPGGEDALVSSGPGGKLKLWRPRDGTLIGEIDTGARILLTGFVAGVVDGRPLAVLSYSGWPMTVYTLHDLTAPPVTLPHATDDVALCLVGPHIITTRTDIPHAVRAWHIDGWWVGVDLRGDAEVTAVACHTWPAVFVGRADGTVCLSDLETGDDLCPPLRLPTRPTAMTVTAHGDLIVGFGSDLARVRPPA
jgi:WD40 repeat protein